MSKSAAKVSPPSKTQWAVENSMSLLHVNFSTHIVLMSVTMGMACLILLCIMGYCIRKKCLHCLTHLIVGSPGANQAQTLAAKEFGPGPSTRQQLMLQDLTLNISMLLACSLHESATKTPMTPIGALYPLLPPTPSPCAPPPQGSLYMQPSVTEQQSSSDHCSTTMTAPPPSRNP